MTKKIQIEDDGALPEHDHPSRERLLSLMHPFRTGLRILNEGLRNEWKKYSHGVSRNTRFLIAIPLSVIVGLYIGKLIVG